MREERDVLMSLAMDVELLRSCVACMQCGLDLREEQALRRRAETIDRRAATTATSLLALRETQWEDLVYGHRAHRHSWYDELAERATIADFAAFMLENWAFPLSCRCSSARAQRRSPRRAVMRSIATSWMSRPRCRTPS